MSIFPPIRPITPTSDFQSQWFFVKLIQLKSLIQIAQLHPQPPLILTLSDPKPLR